MICFLACSPPKGSPLQGSLLFTRSHAQVTRRSSWPTPVTLSLLSFLLSFLLSVSLSGCGGGERGQVLRARVVRVKPQAPPLPPRGHTKTGPQVTQKQQLKTKKGVQVSRSTRYPAVLRAHVISPALTKPKARAPLSAATPPASVTPVAPSPVMSPPPLTSLFKEAPPQDITSSQVSAPKVIAPKVSPPPQRAQARRAIKKRPKTKIAPPPSALPLPPPSRSKSRATPKKREAPRNTEKLNTEKLNTEKLNTEKLNTGAWPVYELRDESAPLEGLGPISSLEASLSPRLLHTMSSEVRLSDPLLPEVSLVSLSGGEAPPPSPPSPPSKRSQASTTQPTLDQATLTHRPHAQGAPPFTRAASVHQAASVIERWRGDEAPRYPIGLKLSPVHASAASWWRRVSLYEPSRTTESVLILGDSLSATPHFLRCFANTEERWGSDEGVRATLQQLGAGWGEGSSLSRVSLAAIPGAPSWQVLKPDEEGRSPLDRELDENPGRFAFVLFGTNDLNYHRGEERFLRSMWALGSRLLTRGVIPIFSTLPHRLTSYEDQLKVLNFNFIVRAISASMRAPLIDLYHHLKPLRMRGLRSDKIHLNAYKGGCDLRSRGVRFGHNLRNYLSLKALSSAEAHLAAAALRGAGAGPLPPPPKTPTRLPATSLTKTPWVWLGDPQLTSPLPPRPQSSCRALREGAHRGFSLPLRLKKAREVALISSELPEDPPNSDQAHHQGEARGEAIGEGGLEVMIEVYDKAGHVVSCVRPSSPLDQRPLPAGEHLVWVLSSPQATRPYLIAIERRR